MKQTDLPPSPKAGIFGGHFIKFRRRPTEFLQEAAELGDITHFKLGGQSAFFLNHPDLIRDLLVVNAHKFMKGRALQRSKRLLGEGLLTSEGEAHLRQRRMIQPAFHRQRIAEYAKAMVSYGERMRDEWQTGEVRDIDREMMRLTLQIVGKTLFNSDVDDEADEVGKAMTTLIELFNYLLIPFSEWLEKLPLPQSKRFNTARDTLNSIIYKIINERRASNEDAGDLLSMLLLAQDEETGGGMSDEQIRDECLTLFLAGHETTANALTFTFYLLSQNPEKEEKLHRELDEVLNGRTPVMEDYGKLKYTEAVFAEAMRLYPPAWAIGRLAIEDHDFGGFEIPKGSLVIISPYIDAARSSVSGKMRTNLFPKDGLTQSVKEAGQKFIYFPFSRGVRSCIGESFAWTEGVLLIAVLMQKWKLRFDARTKDRAETVDDSAPEIRNEDADREKMNFR